jgi:capsular polysaccharide biosynthesis protein
VIIEGVPGVDSGRCDLATDHLMHGGTTAFVATKPARHIDCGLFLGGNGSDNYYHWMMEILPKLQFLSTVDDAAGRPVPLLVSAATTRIGSLAASLRHVPGEREVVEMAPMDSYRVRELYYVNAPSVCPFNLRRGARIRVSDFLIRPSSVRFARDRMLNEATRAGGRGSRLFLARPSVRRHYNQEEVLAAFGRHGFVETYLEELSLAEQVDVVAGADWLAGPSGAAWANLIFATPGTRAVCWMPDEAAEFAAYSNIAKIAGVDLRYVTYPTRVGSTRDLYTTRYRIDPRRLESRLVAMLEAAS